MSSSAENPTTSFHLQDVHVWMRHAEGEHQVLLKRAEELPDDHPELLHLQQKLATTSDLNWNITEPRGLLQATYAGHYMAKYFLSPGPNGEDPIVQNGMFDGGYTSPMNRAEQTVGVSLLAAASWLGRSAIRMDNGNPIIPIDLRLREINLGVASYLTKREYLQSHPDNIARRRVDPLFTSYQDGRTIPEQMDLSIRSLHTTLNRDADREADREVRTFHTTLNRDKVRKGSNSALMSTHGRTIRAAAMTIRRDHPRDFPEIERNEEVKNCTMFVTRRTPDSPGFNQFAFITPWIELDNGEIAFNDTPPNFIHFKAPSSRSYEELLHGLRPELVEELLQRRPPEA